MVGVGHAHTRKRDGGGERTAIVGDENGSGANREMWAGTEVPPHRERGSTREPMEACGIEEGGGRGSRAAATRVLADEAGCVADGTLIYNENRGSTRQKRGWGQQPSDRIQQESSEQSGQDIKDKIAT